MLDIFTIISDIIAPPHTSVVTLRTISPDQFLPLLAPRKVNETIALTAYHEPLIKAAITANKFHNHQKASRVLGLLLGTWLASLPEKPTYLVPIPLGSKRFRERGYNQVERIIRSVTSPSIQVANLLTRQRDTAPQTTLEKKARLHNLTGAFLVTKPLAIPPGSRVIICDDVITTGATLRTAAKALTPHLPKDCELLTVALAH
jgi:ComF family protein